MTRRIRSTGLAPGFGFRTLRPRSYGYNDTARTQPPDDGNLMALTPKQAEALHPRGNDYPDVIAGSRAVIDRESLGGSRTQFAADHNELDLNGGRPPRMIRRMTTARNAGAVWFGSGTGQTARQAIDAATDGGAMYIPHQRIPRTPITVTAFRRTVDNTSTIPARGIAAPVKVIGS